MATIKEALDKLIKSDEYEERWISLDDLCKEFEIYDYVEQNQDSPRFRVYFLHKWYCTDSWVGYRAWFLDEELIAVTQQVGRKYDEEFHWVSKEAFEKAFDVIMSLHKKKEFHIKLMEDKDWNHKMKNQ